MKHKILLVDNLRKLEKDYIETTNSIFAHVLMELAGYNIFAEIKKFIRKSTKIAIIANTGNNGGDGLVLARHLILNNYSPDIFIVNTSRSQSLDKAFRSNECLLNYNLLLNLKKEYNNSINITEIKNSDEFNLTKYQIIIDALFGSGLNKEIRGLYFELIDYINKSNKFIISIDLPSGINGDNGQIMGIAIKANITYVLGYYKMGLYCFPGSYNSGMIKLIDIGLPFKSNQKPDINLIDLKLIKKLLPIRQKNSHKGTYGSNLTIGCSTGMQGSGYMTSLAAFKSGIGLSYLAAPKSVAINFKPSELIYIHLEETPSGGISLENISHLETIIKSKNSLVIGPGLGQNDNTQEFIIQLIKLLNKKYSNIPKVFDADALNIISLNSITELGINTILTPHPKELARLLQIDVAEVQSDRLKYTKIAAHKFNSIIVLKGSNTIIYSPCDTAYVNNCGNSGLAKGGSGDVLAGIIASFLSNGLNCLDAAVLGVYFHAKTGDLILKSKTAYCMTPFDIINNLHKTYQYVLSKRI